MTESEELIVLTLSESTGRVAWNLMIHPLDIGLT